MSFDSKTPGKFTPEMGRLAQVLVNQTSSAIIKTKLYEETQLALRRMEALHDIDRIITSSVDLLFTIEQITQIIVSQLEIDAVNVVMYNPDSLTFRVVNSIGIYQSPLNQKHLTRDRITTQFVLERKELKLENQADIYNHFSNDQEIIQAGFKSFLGVPLIVKGEIKGILELFHKSALETDLEWEDFLQTLATQLAIAIDNSQMFRNLQKSHLELTLSYDATIEGWAKTLELRDRETQGHSERVTSMAVKLARILGLGKEDLIHVRRGALLHDVGKIGIPNSILQKPDNLTGDEWKIMREHPTLAYNVLSGSEFLEKALDIPYSHHEKWDGTGYPNQLKGEEIPVAARIFAIIDVYDALRSDRPYRNAWSKSKTLKHIKGQSGSHFDPRVVEEFLKIVKKDPDFNDYED
jgi:putative nucleotidyltransferase with HDIG domain